MKKIILTAAQNKIKNFDFNEKHILVEGVSGSGKTTSALERYKKMIEKENIKSDTILVLVLNRLQSLNWRKNLSLKASSELKITSYFGFVQDQVYTYWPIILKNNPLIDKNTISPTFMTFESSQCLMHKLIEFFRDKNGLLSEVTSPQEQIAMDLSSNLLKAAVSDIPFNEIGKRLYDSLEEKDLVKRKIFKDCDTILNFYIKRCLKKGILDYALSVYLYNNFLLNDEEYKFHLLKNIKHIIVDNLEEAVPSQVDLVKFLLPNMKTSLLFYNPEGGHGVKFGTDSLYITKNIGDKLSKFTITDSFTSRKEFFILGDILEKNILFNKNKKFKKEPVINLKTTTELRSEMIESIITDICNLLDKGEEAQDIVVICPFIDVALEYLLQNQLAERNVKVVNIGRKSRMIDNEYIHALIVVACLAHNYPEIILNKDDIRTALSLILNLDIIRSSLLASRGFVFKDNEAFLEDINDTEIIKRVGEPYIEKYRELKNWIEEYKSGEPLKIDEFFRCVYLELLIKIPSAEQNLKILKQLIDSAENFVKVISQFENIKDPSFEYIKIIKEGVKAAESIFDIKERYYGNHLILATPITYLASGKSSKYQFWTDLKSEMWTPRNIKDIENPYVLTKTWDVTQVYTEEMELKNQREKLVKLVKCLLKKCTGELFLYDSRYSASGFEQEGIFSEILLNTFSGRGFASEV